MKILLGVCGSISAYRAYDLMRLFIKNGDEVKVVISSGALSFVHSHLFSQLGASSVHTDESSKTNPSIDHIDLANWADKFVIAPASANSIAKFAHGLADSLLAQLFLAYPLEKPLFIFEAMNTKMLNHPMYLENKLKIKDKIRNSFFFATNNGALACGEVGDGKLLDNEEIFHLVSSITLESINKTILIANGATRSHIDPVRFVTNPASGKTGFEFCLQALQRGYKVIVINGGTPYPDFSHITQHPKLKLINVSETSEMSEAVKENLPLSDIYITPAAICDLEFKKHNSKLKKKSFDNSFSPTKAVDILQQVLQMKTHQKIVGFAAETDLSDEILQEKYNRKPVDLLVGTKVFSETNKTEGFKASSAYYKILKNGNLLIESNMRKEEMVKAVLENIMEQ